MTNTTKAEALIREETVSDASKANEADDLFGTPPTKPTILVNRGIVVGIDPGLGGAIACVSVDTKKLLAVYDMPILKKENSKAWVKREADAESMVHIIRSIHEEGIRFGGPGVVGIAVEEVASRPAQGVASVFSFGHSFGIAIGVAAFLYPTAKTIRIAPTVWKSHFGLDWSKAKSLAKAKQFFGDPNGVFKKQRSDGRAEAALIALYSIDVWSRLVPNRAKREKA